MQIVRNKTGVDPESTQSLICFGLGGVDWETLGPVEDPPANQAWEALESYVGTPMWSGGSQAGKPKLGAKAGEPKLVAPRPEIIREAEAKVGKSKWMTSKAL